MFCFFFKRTVALRGDLMRNTDTEVTTRAKLQMFSSIYTILQNAAFICSVDGSHQQHPAHSFHQRCSAQVVLLLFHHPDSEGGTMQASEHQQQWADANLRHCIHLHLSLVRVANQNQGPDIFTAVWRWGNGINYCGSHVLQLSKMLFEHKRVGMHLSLKQHQQQLTCVFLVQSCNLPRRDVLEPL